MPRRTYAEIKLVGGSDYERLLGQKRAARRRNRAKHPEVNRERDRVAKVTAYASDPEKFRQAKRDEYRSNPEKFLRQKKKWRLENPEKARAKDEKCNLQRDWVAHRKRERTRRYGITPEQFDALSVLQNEKCAICRAQLTHSAHVDHCHKTGEVRGLLCNRCNAGLGMFADDPKKIRAAVNYLERGANRLAVAAQHSFKLKEA